MVLRDIRTRLKQPSLSVCTSVYHPLHHVHRVATNDPLDHRTRRGIGEEEETRIDTVSSTFSMAPSLVPFKRSRLVNSSIAGKEEKGTEREIQVRAPRNRLHVRYSVDSGYRYSPLASAALARLWRGLLPPLA